MLRSYGAIAPESFVFERHATTEEQKGAEGGGIKEEIGKVHESNGQDRRHPRCLTCPRHELVYILVSWVEALGLVGCTYTGGWYAW